MGLLHDALDSIAEVTDGEFLDALLRVLEHYGHDEYRHFMADPCEGHVFLDLAVVLRFLELKLKE